MSNELANVQAYSIKPQGKFVMVVAEMAPIKSASGNIEIMHVKGVDEVLRRGLVVAVGPEVKDIKKGQRVLFLFNTGIEPEQFYRSMYRSGIAPKYLLKEEHVVAVIKDELVEAGKDDSETTVRCLKPEIMNAERVRANEASQENFQSAMADPKIIKPRFN
jgi:hypothetical protein